MAREPEPIETEGFKNQRITRDAAARVATPAGRKSGKKVVALQLNAREHLALELLGGVAGLKNLLAPEGLCLRCRKAPALPDSPRAAYCTDCLPG